MRAFLLLFVLLLCDSAISSLGGEWTLFKPSKQTALMRKSKLPTSSSSSLSSTVFTEEMQEQFVIALGNSGVLDKESYALLLQQEGSLAQDVSRTLLVAEEVYQKEDARLWLSKDSLIVSLKGSTWPLGGWRTFGLSTVKANAKAKQQPQQTYTFCWVNVPKKCQVLVQIKLRADETVKVVLQLQSTNVSKKQRKRVIALLKEALEARVENDIALACSRVRTSQTYAQESTQTLKKIKARELDKVLNPEKYKSQSPTVRRPGGGSRFTPNDRTRKKQQTQIVRRSGG